MYVSGCVALCVVRGPGCRGFWKRLLGALRLTETRRLLNSAGSEFLRGLREGVGAPSREIVNPIPVRLPSQHYACRIYVSGFVLVCGCPVLFDLLVIT